MAQGGWWAGKADVHEGRRPVQRRENLGFRWKTRIGRGSGTGATVGWAAGQTRIAWIAVLGVGHVRCEGLGEHWRYGWTPDEEERV
jgi:hypothetical protein